MALFGDDEVNVVFNEINEELIFQIPPISKITAFAGFSEVITGGTFTREFRFTNDGVIFTEFDDVANIGAITPNSDLPFLFELKYKLIAGAVPQTVLEFFIDATQDIGLDHSFDEFLFPNVFDELENSNFDFVSWCANVRDKFEKSGIIPEFVQRTEDYTAFWESVTCFFALMYALTQEEFANLFTNRDNLREYMTQRGMFFCGEELLIELQTLANEFYKEIAKRGTSEVDEEIKRILCIDNVVVDWLFIIFIDKEDNGWNLGFTSPMHVGFQGVVNANMMKQKGPGLDATSDWELFNPSTLTVFTLENIPDVEGVLTDVLKIDQTAEALAAESGVRLLASFTNWDAEKLTIDSTYSYVVEFWAIVESPDNDPDLRFGVEVTDKDNNVLSLLTFEAVPSATNEFSTGGATTVFLQQDTYRHFIGIIYAKDLVFANDDGILDSNFQGGRNLQFDSGAADAKYLYPFVRWFKTSGGATVNSIVKMWDLRVAPAYAGTGVTQDQDNHFALGGYFTTTSLLYNFMKNNGPFSEDELNKIMERYLFPAATDVFNNFTE